MKLKEKRRDPMVTASLRVSQNGIEILIISQSMRSREINVNLLFPLVLLFPLSKLNLIFESSGKGL